MKKISINILILFFIFMFISSIFGFQIARYDTHIKDEDVRNSMLILKGLMAFSSFNVMLFLFLKKYKIVFIFLIMFVSIILYNIIENELEVDKCLDKGGAWNYPKGLCITDKNVSIEEVKCLSKYGSWNREEQLCEGLR